MLHGVREKMEKIISGTGVKDVFKLVPGVMLAFFIWYVSEILCNFIGTTIMGFKSSPVSTIMVTIMIGILIRNSIGLHPSFVSGTSFCLKRILRLGIILMGIRLSFFDVLRIGGIGIPIVVLSIATGLFVTTYATRLMKLSERLGTLIAVGTGICGASAIVATAPTIEATEEEVTYAVTNITLFGVLAMFVYPYLADLIFAGNRVLAGLFLGTSIHETAQVAGGAIIYDQYMLTKSSAGLVSVWGAKNPLGSDVALVTKLTRNAFMTLVIPFMAFYYANKNSHHGRRFIFSRKYFPFFILGFIFMAIFRTVGEMTLMGAGKQAFGLMSETQWRDIVNESAKVGGVLLAVAMAGVGLGTSFRNLKTLGIRPFIIGLLASFTVGIISVIAAFLLGPYIRFQ
jgi:uncharacterized integral membrane protein (TIGR00698 family)